MTSNGSLSPGPSFSVAGAQDRVVRTFIAQLHHTGVHHAVICPGSRSTPLTLAFARDKSFRSWLHLDERSAGYFALGLARQLGEAVALVCTSGTAAANFLPAVIEASISRIPLVVLTADRPPEARDVGAAQTIDQVRLYGSHVRWFVDMPPADGTAALEHTAQAAAARAASLAIEAPMGPVHVNFPFREPLVEASPSNAPLEPPHAPIDVTRVAQAPSPEAIAAFVEAARGRRGLIVAGPESVPLPAGGITSLALHLGWPVLADPLSGLRAGPHRLDPVVETYDALLRDARFAATHVPEVVLRFGQQPTSKPLFTWLAAHREVPSFVVDVAGGWRDPDATTSTMLRGDAAVVIRAVEARLGQEASAPAAWLEGWQHGNEAAAIVLRSATADVEEPFEGRVPVELAEALPDGATLVCGNSMPIRDVDSFFPRLEKRIRIVGTRGASGIDGVVSTAVGAVAAGQGPVVLLIGDLSFLHDLNGLWPLRRYDLDLTVVLVNNDGGGIFHFLPQAELAPDAFEEWFGTPHGLDLRHGVEIHGGRYELLEGARGWAGRIARAIEEPGLKVLEVRTERVRNVELHRRAWARVSEGLASSSAPAEAEATR